MTDQKSFILHDRLMVHRPWIKSSEWKRYSGHQRKSWPQKGSAVRSVFEAFIKAGGDGGSLCGMINSYIPEKKYMVEPEELLDEERRFSLEYYFYLTELCKYLLDNEKFRYQIDAETRLPGDHYIFEQGPMKFTPWIDEGEKNKTGYLSLTNIKCFFDYTEHAMQPVPYYSEDKESAGREISDLVSRLLNSRAGREYKINKDFIDQVGILVSLEYILYTACFFEVLTNDVDFNLHSMYYGFKNSNILAKSIFIQPDQPVAEGFINWQKQTNNFYNYDLKQGRRTISIKFSLKNLLGSGMCGLYEEIAVKKCMQGNPAASRAFIEHSTGKAVDFRVLKRNPGEDFFTVRLKWKPSYSYVNIIAAAAGAPAILLLLFFISNLFLSGHSANYLYMATGALFCGFLAGLNAYRQSKSRTVQKQFLKSKELVLEQLEYLKHSSAALLKERNALDQKVKERTAELNEALEQLKQLDRSKTNFIAAVSHELRTPLTLLSVPLEGIKNGRYGKKLDSESHVFSLIERNVIRLKNQINQLLDFSRLDLGTMVFEPQLIELTGYCRGLAAELESLADKKGLYLAVDNRAGADEVFIKADKPMLETVALNLLNNALKFTEKGGIQIIVSKTPDDEKIILTVKDTGIGFTPDDKSQIFKRFTQAEESRERHREGAGLGLALVSEIAERHGWGLEAEGRPGEGSEFSIIMQAADGGGQITADYSDDNSLYSSRQERMEPGLLFPKQENDGIKDKKKDTILIVEDNPDMWIVLQDLLSSEYNLKWCAGGRAALVWLKSKPQLSMIICDVMMPGMSGFSFRRNMLKDNDYSTLPFIYLTALADPQEKAEGLKTGAVDYIQKPFVGNELLLKVRNLVESYKSSYLQAVKDRQSVERLSRIAAGIISEPSDQERAKFGITKAEQRVVELVRLGLQDKEIAAELSISARTVSSHLSHLYQKTDTQNRVELINKLY